jgi:hypothetical protein
VRTSRHRTLSFLFPSLYVTSVRLRSHADASYRAAVCIFSVVLLLTVLSPVPLFSVRLELTPARPHALHLHGFALHLTPHETSCRYVLATIHFKTFRVVRSGIPKSYGTVVSPSYIYFSQASALINPFYSPFQGGTTKYLSGLCLIDSVLHPDENCGNWHLEKCHKLSRGCATGYIISGHIAR